MKVEHNPAKAQSKAKAIPQQLLLKNNVERQNGTKECSHLQSGLQRRVDEDPLDRCWLYRRRLGAFGDGQKVNAVISLT